MARTLPIKLRTIAAGVVVIASGLIIWNTYLSIINSTDGEPRDLPIIRADTTPFRVLPDDPGGAEIPNQGSTLFNVLRDDNADSLSLSGMEIKLKAEDEETSKLFEIEEDAPAVETGFALPTVVAPKMESLFAIVEELDSNNNETKEQSPEPTVDIEPKEDNVEQEILAKKIEAINIVPLSKPEKEESIIGAPKTFSLDRILDETAESTPAQKQFYIQLASFRNLDDAKASYDRISRDFTTMVAGVEVFYPTVDLGERGVFTRLQIGPLSQAEAKKRCADYTASSRGGTCLVISR